MASRFKTQEDFLNHSGQMESGSRSNFLMSWRKKGHVDPKEPDVRYIDVWLHTIAVPQARWTHGWHKIEVRESRETKRITKEVWSDAFVCHEEEAVLKKQYKRRDDGSREAFPEFCPSCRLVEVVYQLVTTGKFVHDGKVIAKGKLSWVEPMFEYAGSDSQRNVILHAAGLYNGYKDIEVGSDEAAALRDANIFPKTAWRETTNSKLTYLFALVDNAEVSKGVQITEEANLLGEKVRQVIAKSCEARVTEEDPKGEAGNPFRIPYAIRWKYNGKDGLGFDKRYDALKLENKPLTEEIKALITSPPKDWFVKKLEVGDPKLFRAVLEKHATEACKKIIPWDWIFDCAVVGTEAASRPAAVRDPAEPPKAGGRTKVKAAPKEPERVVCGDGCDAMLLPTDRECPKCHATFNVDAEPAAPPPRAAASTNGRTAPAAPTKPPVEDEDLDGDDDSDLPF